MRVGIRDGCRLIFGVHVLAFVLLVGFYGAGFQLDPDLTFPATLVKNIIFSSLFEAIWGPAFCM